MATLTALKLALEQTTTETASSIRQQLSEAQYSIDFDIAVHGSGRVTYQDFIIPQLSDLINPLCTSRSRLSVLEIAPGPKSAFGHLPYHLRHWSNGSECPLPCLDGPPVIHRSQFILNSKLVVHSEERFDVILFHHSMRDIKTNRNLIEQALGMLVGKPEDGIVVGFYPDGTVDFDGLVCQRTASFPSGSVSLVDDDKTLDCFARFVAGFTIQEAHVDNKAISAEWRRICRAMGRRDAAQPGYLFFASSSVMVVFTQHSSSLRELTALLPVVEANRTVKNRDARLQKPATIVRPTEIRHIQETVRWALKHQAGLTIIGGSHSGHCLQSNVVAVDMAAFNKVFIDKACHDGGESVSSPSYGLVTVEAGCTTGEVINHTMVANMTVPLGSRPSVGAGSWLQGGIGHISRLHGLACDAIVGAVVVSMNSGQVLSLGHVPSKYRPEGAIETDEKDLLWGIKGAGTNFGVVVSITFKGYMVPIYLTRRWDLPLKDRLEGRSRLSDFDGVAQKLPRHCSADTYLYEDTDQLYLGVTMFETSTTGVIHKTETRSSTPFDIILGPPDKFEIMDAVGIFETEMYMSRMDGGRNGDKTSSFKRCIFLKNIGQHHVASILVASVDSRPSPLCYLYFLQGGGAIADLPADATAFGCRDWDFACVVTGAWPRDQDGTAVARAAVQWVFDVVATLLPLSCGAYGADLGPDPRDVTLARKAFGPNLPRLTRLKRSLDPHHVLTYACPLPNVPVKPRLIILVSGDSCAGKDYCADVWFSIFADNGLLTRGVSISKATKVDYAAFSGADLSRLLHDRVYKEQHRPALTAFFQEQVRQRPRLPEEHFLAVVHSAWDIDVLIITGMRDEAPVSMFSPLIPDSRLIDVRVKASEKVKHDRRGWHGDENVGDAIKIDEKGHNVVAGSISADYVPNLIFVNNITGNEAARQFAVHYLLPFVHRDLERLADMVPSVFNFPRPGIEFRHVLNICQQPGGLALCVSLMQRHFIGDWAKVDAVACCEAGGFVYASALAVQVDVPLVLIREAGKLPPPTISVFKSASHISSVSSSVEQERIEMARDAVPGGGSVVVVDDVLATGVTLCAVLELLAEAGIFSEHVSIMVIAEFPIHGGRELLRQRGFGRACIQSLLVFGGP